MNIKQATVKIKHFILSVLLGVTKTVTLDWSNKVITMRVKNSLENVTVEQSKRVSGCESEHNSKTTAEPSTLTNCMALPMQVFLIMLRTLHE